MNCSAPGVSGRPMTDHKCQWHTIPNLFVTSLPLCTSDVSSFHFNLRILSSFIWNHSLILYFRYLLQPSANLKPTKTWSKSTLLKEMCVPYSLRYLKRYLHLLQLIPLINQKRRTLLNCDHLPKYFRPLALS